MRVAQWSLGQRSSSIYCITHLFSKTLLDSISVTLATFETAGWWIRPTGLYRRFPFFESGLMSEIMNGHYFGEVRNVSTDWYAQTSWVIAGPLCVYNCP